MTKGDPQLLPSRPDTPVQDVLLDEAEEGLHGGVVRTGHDLAHRSDEIMMGESLLVFLRSEVASTIRMDNAARDVTAHGDGVVQRVSSQT